MNIKTIIQNIKGKISPQEQLQDEVVIRFLKILDRVREEEMSCEEMYEQLDEFVEQEVQSKEASSTLMPLIQEHLDMCPDCCDEYEALLTVLENTKEK
jgi:DNA-binding transcriptional MerR regulator